jgi:hypothetical protein
MVFPSKMRWQQPGNETGLLPVAGCQTFELVKFFNNQRPLDLPTIDRAVARRAWR